MNDFDLFSPNDPFPRRHIGPRERHLGPMLEVLELDSLEDLMQQVIPANIRLSDPLTLENPKGESGTLADLQGIASQNQVYRSYIGMGYYNSIIPGVIQRNILEDPGWYTQYTPYQAEIAQGRLEALMNFQTMASELTALPFANASLLDEATAAAEAMAMCWAINRRKSQEFFVSSLCHPQTIAVVQTRAKPLGIEIRIGDPSSIDFETADIFGVLVQYPTTDGSVEDYSQLAERAHAAGALLVAATDLLALTLLKPPGEFGADIAIGSSQRFGVPLGYGGPHAAFMTTRTEYERFIPGRVIGLSRDDEEGHAFRLARQTREQHIRREKATSNICTAQVLLAVMASMYAVYHGPEGLKKIALQVRGLTDLLAKGLRRMGFDTGDGVFFDTLKINLDRAATTSVITAARSRCVNLRQYDDGSVGISLDQTVTRTDIEDLLLIFSNGRELAFSIDDLMAEVEAEPPAEFARTSPFLQQRVFHRFHAEHEMLRYIQRLRERDLSLAFSMIPLGSCTMKLNASSEMFPITWAQFAHIHPFAPIEQTAGYGKLFEDLEKWLGEITGLRAVSLQPNAGSQGELSGLLVIRAYHETRGEGHRNICLVPMSAHGTNPASSVMAGYKVVPVESDSRGDFDLEDLTAKAEKHRDHLAAIMITYPSTHGVFEEHVKDVCDIVHANGGQVYLDGANMNAQVGLVHLSDLGADVCHLNLHKTFAIPHGGGGPGVGPICAAEHLAPYLPGHPLVSTGGTQAIGPVAAAPHGSAGVLPISWMYIAMMGAQGLTRASQIAILNANYMARRLAPHYPILYTNQKGFVAHEFILDFRDFKESAGISVDDVAKRLMDYGFHAPTMSWPVAGTMMVEPTESESMAELDRFCDALIAIRDEIRAIETGAADRENNILRHAPHTSREVTADAWDRPYTREQAAFPAPWVRERKFWPPVGRIDNAWGDRNLVCTCDPIEDFLEELEVAATS